MTRSLAAALALLPLVGVFSGCTGEPPTCEDRGVAEVEWFLDRDRDGFGTREQSVFACQDQDPSVAGGDTYVTLASPEDCDDLRPEVFPGAPEVCDGLDNNCNGATDEGLPVSDFWVDADGDGFGDPDQRVESCFTPPGATTNPNDCDDSNAAVNPDAVEICNGIDDDCDELIDDADDAPLNEGGVDTSTGSPFRPDNDEDGFGNWNAATEVWACTQPEGFTPDTSDCDDEDEEINPSAQEVCDGRDNDCNQLFDDSDPNLDTSTQTLWYRDADADGFGVPDETLLTCTTPWFWALNADDCDDSDPNVLSEALTTWALDVDGDGFGTGEVAPSEPSCTPPAPGMVSLVPGVDCDDDDDQVFPGQVEVCDEIDNDCDDLIDDADLWFEEGGVDVDTMTPWFTDADGDGFGNFQEGFLSCAPLPGEVADFTDCLDNNPDINPAATEVCDGVDNDCDGLVDDNDPSLDVDSGEVFTRDADGDGWGDLTNVIRACEEPDGYVLSFGDCDDNDPEIGLPTNWWPDLDGDGQGSGEVIGPASCDPPSAGVVPWYVDSLEDCAPEDPLALSGVEICYDGIDQGCNGLDYTPGQFCDAELPGTCAEAEAMEPILADNQRLRGSLVGKANLLNVAQAPAGCIDSPSPLSAAEEIVIPVLVPAGRRLRVQFSITGGDGVIYLLSDCNQISSCVDGADIRATPGSQEILTYDNLTADDELLYLVGDGRQFFDSRDFTLILSDLAAPATP